MEPIRFTLNDLYLVIDPFKFSRMNGVIAVIENTVLVSFQRIGKGIDRRMIYRSSQ